MDRNRDEFNRWFKQGQFDLEAARNSEKNGSYEWSCFQAQQSAEKALKAYLYLKGKRGIISHSVTKLINFCKQINGSFLNIEECRILDQYYIPTRYPNGLPDEIPHTFYQKGDAILCIQSAQKVIKLVQKLTGH